MTTMFDDRKHFNFLTIFCWLSLLSILTRYNVQTLSIPKTHTHDNEIGHGHEFTTNSNSNGNGNGDARPTDVTVVNFSPRLEYNNEWRPVGRGDPLKNDPTYDYSPPALERVRYWRSENETKDETKNAKHFKKDYAANGKKEVLMPNERQRGQPMHSAMAMLQPKYTSIRRSYYAHQHQLPTHLMPPPMQTLASPSNMMKTSVPADYRHSMPPSTATTSTTTMSMMNSKPYFSTSASSSPWMHPSMHHSSLPTSVSSSTNYKQHPNSPHMMHEHYHHQDHKHQDSIDQFMYARPNSGAAYKPNNFIESNQNFEKPRKPWLHELLQKEVVKAPPQQTPHRYSTNYENVMTSSMGMATTYAPIAFVPLPTITTTKTPQTTTSTTTQFITTTSPVYFTTTAATVAATAATPTRPSSQLVTFPTSPPNRLLIPTTSNLVHRPTVTPMEMTTDALFKHYKQPAKPLLGPMYLIIEGHSKVKTYGKDELDPHRPKIVPIIPKREPVVRIADPNEKRGTLETFQVKHLHTKVTAALDETTKSNPSSTSTSSTTTATTTTTTVKPTKAIFSLATATTKKTQTTAEPTTTPATSKGVIKLNNSFSNSSASTTPLPSGGMQGFFNFLDSSFGNLFSEDPTTDAVGTIDDVTSTQKNQIFVTTTPGATVPSNYPITTIKPKIPKIEPRISSQSSKVESDYDAITTEPAPRDVRQIFDYDQLPESRLKDRMDINSNENDDDDDAGEEGVIDLHDDSIEDIDMEDIESITSSYEYENDDHKFFKRIDKLVDGDGDGDDDDNVDVGNVQTDLDDLISAEVDSDDDLEMRRTKEA